MNPLPEIYLTYSCINNENRLLVLRNSGHMVDDCALQSFSLTFAGLGDDSRDR